MKVLLALEQTRISAGAIRLLSKVKLPAGTDLFLLHVNPIPQQLARVLRRNGF
jgi:hypothetical protein